jgi:transposase
VRISTLRNWIDGRCERKADHSPADRQEDMAAELKRSRLENEPLRQEREILKRTKALFAKEGSR